PTSCWGAWPKRESVAQNSMRCERGSRTMAETRRTKERQTSRAAGKARKDSASKARKDSASSQRKGAQAPEKKPSRGTSSSDQASTSGRPAGRGNGLSAAEAVSRARETLSELLGRRVESVLGIDRDHGNWVAT